MADERMKAAAAGEPHYHGVPCKHGHGTERYTITNACVACNRLRVKAYQKRVKRRVRQLMDSAQGATGGALPQD